MLGRDPNERHRAATPLELLFDLTFVIAFGSAASELAHFLAEDHVSEGVVGFAFATFAVTWAWINFSWFASAYDTDDYTLTAVARGVGNGRYDATGIECQTGSCPVWTNQFPTYEDNSIGGATYVDANATFKFDAFGGKNGEFFVNVTNLFDADPILLPETGLAVNSTYSDLLGRAFRVGMRLKLR